MGIQSSEDHEKGSLFLYISVLSVTLLGTGTGSSYSWTSPVLPKLKGLEGPSNNPFDEPLTALEESWVTSLLSLGASIGPLLSGFCVDRIGRKRTLLIFAVPMIAANVMIAFATKVEIYYVARFLLGIGNGCVFLITPMYVGEVSQPSNRGLLGCLISVLLTLGTFSSYVIGPYTSIMTFSLISTIPMVTSSIITAVFIPETPYYHMLKNDCVSAEKSLMKLRGRKDVGKELEEISTNVSESLSNHRKSIRDLFKSRVLTKGLTISVGLMFFQQFTGITVLIGYMQSIFDGTGTKIPPHISSISIGVIHPMTCLLTSQLVDRLGRRFLLIVSMVGVSISLSVLVIYFHLQSLNYDLTFVFWLPITCLVLYTVWYNIGIGPLPWAMMGELFPSDVKALASVITTVSCLLLAFVTSLFFPNFLEYAGFAASFGVFALVSIAGIFFMCFVVPETKGKTFEEIQTLLK